MRGSKCNLYLISGLRNTSFITVFLVHNVLKDIKNI